MDMTITLHGYSGPHSEQCTVQGHLTEKGCKSCKGSGRILNPNPYDEPDWTGCTACDGTGERLTPLGEMFRDFVARYVNGRLPTS